MKAQPPGEHPEIEVAVRNLQKRLRVNSAAIKRLTAFFLQKAALRDPGLRGEVTVAILDDAGMRGLNRKFLGRDETTDVLSFRYANTPAIPGAPAGECIVNAEQALRLGPRHGGVWLELALYIAHACNHLAGGEDATDGPRRRMRRRERNWLRAAASRGLLSEEVLLRT